VSVNSPRQGSQAIVPGQCIPSNHHLVPVQTSLYVNLFSTPRHSTFTTTPLSIIGQWAYAFLHRLNGVTISLGSRSVSRGEWGESSLGGHSGIRLANHIPRGFSDGCIHSGRVGCISAQTIEQARVMRSSRCRVYRTAGSR